MFVHFYETINNFVNIISTAKYQTNKTTNRAKLLDLDLYTESNQINTKYH